MFIKLTTVQVRTPEDHYTWGWIGWATVSAGGFVLLEGYAVRNGHHDRTLSVHTRRILGIYPRKPWAIAGRAGTITAMVGFCTWFAHHIAFCPGDDPRFRVIVNHTEVGDEQLRRATAQR